MEENKEILLTSAEELNEYLKKTGDDRTVISIVLELAGNEATEGGDTDGR